MKNLLLLTLLLAGGTTAIAQPPQTLYHPNGKKYLEGRFTFVQGGALTAGESWSENGAQRSILQFPRFSSSEVYEELRRRPRTGEEKSLYNPATYLGIVCEGPVTYYEEKGPKAITITYAGGIMSGPYTEYYAPGKVLQQGQVLNGMANGAWTYYYPNGQPFYTGTYRAYTQAELKVIWTKGPKENAAENTEAARTLKSGLSAEEQYLSYKILRELSFLRMPMTGASKEGVFTFWYKNGAKLAEGSYTNNQPAGEWKVWQEETTRPIKFQLKDGFVVAGTNDTGTTFTIQELHQKVEQNTIRPRIIKPDFNAPEMTSGVSISESPVSSPQNSIFTYVEQMPEFEGNLNDWLTRNMRYPPAAKAAGIEGRVVVRFVVGEDGGVSDAKVEKSVSPELDAEALRLVNALPKWKPAKQNGKAVKVNYRVPVKFILP